MIRSSQLRMRNAVDVGFVTGSLKLACVAGVQINGREGGS